MFKELLLNTLIVIIPVFVYQLLRLEQYRRTFWMPHWLLGIICGLSSVLCMMFPVISGNSFLWDLRWVPFIISALYGGYRGAMIAGACLIIYRGYVEIGLAFYLTATVAILLSCLIFPVRKKFTESNFQKKIVIGFFLLVCSYIVVLLSIWYHVYAIGNLSFFMHQGPKFFSLAILCNLGAGLCNIILFERIYENVRMQEEVSKAEKLNLVSELAASIAHEVRNPLTVVRGFIQLTKENVTNQHRHFMETAISELDRAESIISDYLSFAKPRAIQKEVLHISQELHVLLELIQSYANLKGVELDSQIDDDLYILGDPLQFKQIILNLVKNAIEATEHTGAVKLQAYAEKENVYIQIIDNGEGMKPEQLQELGKPYYSTKEKGTGLGLLITLRLVEEYSGRLLFDSEYGKGTTATLRFPLQWK